MVHSQRSDVSVSASAPYSGLLGHERVDFSVFERDASTGARLDPLRCRYALPTSLATVDGSLGVYRPRGRQAASAIGACGIKAGGLLTSAAGVHEVFIEDLVNEHAPAECRSTAREVTDLDWQNLVVDGPAVGKHTACVNVLRATATSTSDLNCPWDQYMVGPGVSLLTLRPTQTLLTRSNYDVAVTFGGLYGPERVFHRVAGSESLPIVIIDGRILNQEWHSVAHAFATDVTCGHSVVIPEWVTFCAHPLDRSRAVRGRVHHEALLESINPLIDSPDQYQEFDSCEVRERLGIPRDKSVLLVPISSPDEEISREFTRGQYPVSGRDSVALQARVVERSFSFARRHPSVHIVIRLHPRPSGEHRTPAASHTIDDYSRLAVDAPANLRINSSSHNLSPHDIALITDFSFLHQATAGLQLLAVGPTVVTSGPGLTAYPLDLAFVTPDSEGVEFVQVLPTKLHSAPDLSRTVGAYRWWGFISNFNRMPSFSEPTETGHGPIAHAPKHPKAHALLTETARKLMPISMKRWLALNIWRWRLTRFAQELPFVQKNWTPEPSNAMRSFLSLASGANATDSGAPMTPEEEAQILRQQVSRRAEVLHVDHQPNWKPRSFVEWQRLEAEKMS